MARPRKTAPSKIDPPKTSSNATRIQRSPKNQKDAKTAVRVASIPASHIEARRELVILTGLSGSGKLSALKAFEDLGYYSVDNLPVELLTSFAELVTQSIEITRAALVVDVRHQHRTQATIGPRFAWQARSARSREQAA